MENGPITSSDQSDSSAEISEADIIESFNERWPGSSSDESAMIAQAAAQLRKVCTETQP